MGKSKHKISNWKQYNQALVQRGSLTVWMDEQAIQQWHCQTHHGRRGRGSHYSEHGREQDDMWNTQVEVVIIPNPCLTPGQQAIIAQDYDMQDGKLRFKRRLPLVHYALDRMQVSYDGQHEERPLLYPLVLANRQSLIEAGCEFKLASALSESHLGDEDPCLPRLSVP